MRRDFLGDALDHWKGDILRRLEEGRAASEVRVLPVFTDAPWPQEDLAIYASLLQRPLNFILQPSKRFPGNSVAEYLTAANEEWTGDLFVDPDTGLHKGGGPTCLTPTSILRLLPEREKGHRLLIVYQHRAQRQGESGLLRAWHDRASALGLPFCTLWSGQAGLFFFSTKDRIERVRSVLGDILGSSAGRRVGPLGLTGLARP